MGQTAWVLLFKSSITEEQVQQTQYRISMWICPCALIALVTANSGKKMGNFMKLSWFLSPKLQKHLHLKPNMELANLFV